MDNFTPVSAIIGGCLIGCSAVLMLGLIGRIAGISGILFGAMELSQNRDHGWRWWFLSGLLLGAACYTWLMPLGFEARTDFPLALLILAGLLVGVGTRMGSGCTSGHGVCGIARLSRRSILATIIFLVTAILTTYIMRHLLGVI